MSGPKPISAFFGGIHLLLEMVGAFKRDTGSGSERRLFVVLFLLWGKEAPGVLVFLTSQLGNRPSVKPAPSAELPAIPTTGQSAEWLGYSVGAKLDSYYRGGN
jgi:hypothetical protein